LSVMDMEYSIGQMVLTTRDIGATTKPKVKARFGTLRAMCTEEISEMIWQMDMESTHILTDQNIKENFEMMCKKDTVKRSGLMALST
jgi:hypothetical protein